MLGQLLDSHYNDNSAPRCPIALNPMKFHRANIFEKLRVNSMVELAHRIWRMV